MEKRVLTKAYRFAGQVYGPTYGAEVEVPTEIAAVVDADQAQQQEAQAVQQTVDAMQTDVVETGVVQNPPVDGDTTQGEAPPSDLATLVGNDLAAVLAATPYTTLDAVRAASDEQLLAEAGIGPARLAKLREATA